MTRIRSFPWQKYSLLKEQLGDSGTVTASDIVGITNNHKFNNNLIKQESFVLGSDIIIKTYKFDENDLSLGSPINQYIDIITESGTSAMIQRIKNNPIEHWSAKLPVRICLRLACGSCDSVVLRSGSVDVAPCLSKWIQSGTIMPRGL